MKSRSGVARMVQGVASQGLYSLSNVALVVAVARTASSAEFGAFSIAWALATLVIQVLRAGVGETLAVTDPDRGRDAMGASLLASAVLAAGMVVASTFMSGHLSGWTLAMAAAVPLLAVQDATRFIAFATHRPDVAVTSDAVWLAMQAVGWTVAIIAGLGTVGVLFAVWAAGAATATLVARRRIGLPSLSGGIAWGRRHGRMASALAVDTVLGLAPSQSTLYAVGFAVGLPAAGAMRGIQSLYGPFRTLLQGVASVALPEAVHRNDDGRREMVSYVATLSAGLGTVAAAGVVVLAMLPDPVGRSLLDDTWPLASSIALPMGLPVLAAAAILGTRVIFRAFHATRTLLILRAFTATAATLAGVAGAVLGGLQGAAWALGVTQLTIVGMAWMVVLRTRDRARVARPAGY